jgi:hypothetical protein
MSASMHCTYTRTVASTRLPFVRGRRRRSRHSPDAVVGMGRKELPVPWEAPAWAACPLLVRTPIVAGPATVCQQEGQCLSQQLALPQAVAAS